MSTNESQAMPDRCATPEMPRNEADDTSALGADRVGRGPNRRNEEKRANRRKIHNSQRPTADTRADHAAWSKSSTASDPCKGSPSLRFLDAFSFHSDHRLRPPSQQRRGSACSGMARTDGPTIWKNYRKLRKYRVTSMRVENLL